MDEHQMYYVKGSSPYSDLPLPGPQPPLAEGVHEYVYDAHGRRVYRFPFHQRVRHLCVRDGSGKSDRFSGSGRGGWSPLARIADQFLGGAAPHLYRLADGPAQRDFYCYSITERDRYADLYGDIYAFTAADFDGDLAGDVDAPADLYTSSNAYSLSDIYADPSYAGGHMDTEATNANGDLPCRWLAAFRLAAIPRLAQ